jgi:urea carboxylase
MVPREEQIEVPKYVQPRTATPSRAVGYGGAFTAIYPVKGAGGYQLFGRTPVEVLDVEQELADFEDSMVLPTPGDFLNFRKIDREEYDAIREEVEDGTYSYDIGRVDFNPREFFEDPEQYNEEILEVLH